jgi:hypothetical protein
MHTPPAARTKSGRETGGLPELTDSGTYKVPIDYELGVMYDRVNT